MFYFYVMLHYNLFVVREAKNFGYFQITVYWTENSTVFEGDCEVSLHSLSQQPLVILVYVKCDRLQSRIELVT